MRFNDVLCIKCIARRNLLKKVWLKIWWFDKLVLSLRCEIAKCFRLCEG